MIDRSALASRSRVLDLSECHDVLRECGWGVLSTLEVASARPYAVPVAYAFDGEVIYIATGRGRKLSALERHPGLCLTVSDVAGFDHWRSVVVIGSACWLSDAAGRAAAVRAFVRQKRPGGTLSPTAAARLILARTLRIQVQELSGRARGADELTSSTIDSAGTGSASREHALLAMDSVRRIVRSLRDLSNTAQGDHQLTAAQLFVLREIGNKTARTVLEVANQTVANPGSVAEVVDRLVQLGFVLRRQVPGNGASGELDLTEAGKMVLAVAPETVQERLVAGFLALRHDDQQRLADLMSSWVAVSGLQDTPPTMFLEPMPSGNSDQSW